MPHPENRKGILSALSAALLFGASIPISKLILIDLQPRVLATLLYFGSGIGLSLWVGITSGGKSDEAPLQRSDLPFLAGAIFFGGVLAPVALLIGLQATPSTTTSLLMNFEGSLTVVLAWLFFRESLGIRVGFGVLAVIAGGVLLTWIGMPEVGSLRGPLMIAGACLCWGLDNNLSQRLSARDPRRIAIIKGVVAGAINFTIAMLLGEKFHDWAVMLQALIVGFFSYGLSLVFYIRALRDLGVARTGSYFSTAPFMGALLSTIFLKEPFTAQLLGAGVLMAIGVRLLASETHEHWHTHVEETHEHRHVHDEHHQHEHTANDPPGEPHTHPHRHERMEHRHPHYPDIHHRHTH